jgi:O-Antigen ligase
VTGDLTAGAGILLAAAAAAAAILLPPSRLRSIAMLAVVALTPVLVFTDQWHATQVADLRDHPARLVALVLLAGAIVAAMTALFRRRPQLLPLAIIAALPFRVPLHSAGDQANLLVPLYLVIAAGVILTTLRDWRTTEAGQAGEEKDRRRQDQERASKELPGTVGGGAGVPPREDCAFRGGSPASPQPIRWLRLLLAAFVVLYALQSLYSEDFSNGIRNVCFFVAPFSVVFALLFEVRWSRHLLVLSLAVVTAEALVFALVGFYEYGVRELLWNDAVIRSNDFHVYFRVNSLFWDPNVYGRYLALVIVVICAAVLWARNRNAALALSAAALVLSLGMVTTFSQSSFAALLAGLITLAALRWSLRWTAVLTAMGAAAAVALAVAAGSSLNVDFSTSNRANVDTSGRASLISGGADLFGDRPVWGYGSGSFSAAFRKHAGGKTPVSESHTEPVTVAAEQGLIGLTLYIALITVSLAVLTSGLRRLMPGLRGSGSVSSEAPPAGGADLGDQPSGSEGGGTKSVTGPAGREDGPAGRGYDAAFVTARAAVLAAFVALLVHTLAYAGFFEDPITWVLLAIGASLAGASPPPDAAAGPAAAAPAQARAAAG